MKHVMLALARAGWGEATLGLRIARDLRARGDRVAIVAHPGLETLFAEDPDVTYVGDEVGTEFEAWMDDVVMRVRPDTFVLSDMLMTFTAMARRRPDPNLLARYDRPIIGVDTWHFQESGEQIDGYPGDRVRIAPTMSRHPRRIVPVPFVRPGIRGGAQVLPELEPISAVRRAEVRERFGLTKPTILVCTSSWQHREYPHPLVQRIQRAVPELLGTYLKRVDAEVVHLGPADLAWDLPVKRVPRVAPSEFRELLQSVDLIVSTNASATSNTTAAVAGVPVVTVYHQGIPNEPPSDEVQAWIDTNLPAFPFAMWPMSFWGVLSRLLNRNPWASVVNMTELTDERLFHQRVSGLLFDESIRQRERERTQAYLAAVRTLPRPADLVRAYAR